MNFDMTNRDKSRQDFKSWWENYHQGQAGEELAWQAWEFGRGIGYQNGYAAGKQDEQEYQENTGGCGL